MFSHNAEHRPNYKGNTIPSVCLGLKTGWDEWYAQSPPGSYRTQRQLKLTTTTLIWWYVFQKVPGEYPKSPTPAIYNLILHIMQGMLQLLNYKGCEPACQNMMASNEGVRLWLLITACALTSTLFICTSVYRKRSVQIRAYRVVPVAASNHS